MLNSKSPVGTTDEKSANVDAMHVKPNLHKTNASGSIISDEEMREPIENALYATKRFLTTEATELSEGILEYLKNAGFTIVRNER